MTTPKLPLRGPTHRKKAKRVIITVEITPLRPAWAKPSPGNVKGKGKKEVEESSSSRSSSSGDMSIDSTHITLSEFERDEVTGSRTPIHTPITYHDKATQTKTEEEDTIEKILKAITTLCTKHDYKNAELRRSKDGKNPELKEDDGKLLKTHNVCLNTAAGTSKQVSDKQHKNANLSQLFEKPFTQRTPRHITSGDIIRENKTSNTGYQVGLTKHMIIPEDIGQQEEICKIEIPSFYANKRIIGISTIIQELANNYLNENAIWSYYSKDQLMIYSNSRELRKADMDEV
ncbi:hypothetical protein H5410_003287 [Solanum commersonii]|uniref:Uncharacterized protein n=1 Tax=Solanum commersonii TaxID=4109 RepID=A0A9J6B4P2_SOLCO|nr:hypothetical protein H5410_003287 [Solanum commersonii]